MDLFYTKRVNGERWPPGGDNRLNRLLFAAYRSPKNYGLIPA
jgi:hypothetical protein